MLNSIGLENPGVEGLLADKLPRLAELGVRSWVSVGGFAASDYAEICSALDDRPGGDHDRAQPLLSERRGGAGERCRDRRSRQAADPKPSTRSSRLPLPTCPRPRGRSQAAGADGLSLVNTIKGLALDERTLEPKLGHELGGYSGPALKPIALAAVYQCYRATGLPIVGMGGISTGRDALDFLAAGATAHGPRDDPLHRPRGARPSAPRTG